MGEGLLGLDKSYDIKLNTIKLLFTAGIIPQPEFSLYLDPDYKWDLVSNINILNLEVNKLFS